MDTADLNIAAEAGAFVGQSGWGRASGFAAIEHYTEVKGVVARL